MTLQRGEEMIVSGESEKRNVMQSVSRGWTVLRPSSFKKIVSNKTRKQQAYNKGKFFFQWCTVLQWYSLLQDIAERLEVQRRLDETSSWLLKTVSPGSGNSY